MTIRTPVALSLPGVGLAAALGQPVLKQNRQVADNAGMAVLVNLVLGGGIGAAIVIGFWLLVSLGDDLRREVRRSGREP